MNTVYKIAKNELYLLFYSPIAWLILVIFAFQASVDYTGVLSFELKDKAAGYSLVDETASLFCNFRGVFRQIQQYLYLYIPLLTMNIMSRELSSGSIKLLFSSPITNRQIVFGKYIALMVYALILIGILVIIALFSLLTVKSMDIPLVLSGLFGLYLLTCAYAAIGLFMSSLTSYQMAAAIGTLAILAVLNLVGTVGQDVALVRDITYWLSISGRSSTIIAGLICSEDVIYFLVVVVLFISLTILKLQAGRKKKSRLKSFLRYSTVVILSLFIGYLSSRPSLMFYYDTTAMKSQTLTSNSQEVMKKMKGGLTITTFVNLLAPNYHEATPRSYNNDVRRFRHYTRFKPEIKMKYVYYYDHAENSSLDQGYPKLNDEERAKELARGSRLNIENFLSPQEIRERIDLSPEENRFVRLLERESGQKSFLRLYDDMSRHPSESEITAALKRLVVKPPKVVFLTGHRERDIYRRGDGDYYTFAKSISFRHSLINQGFDMDTLSISGLEEIPADVDVLVISDVRDALTPREQEMILRYIDSGKDLLLATKPGRQKFLQPIAESLGIQFTEGIVVQQHEDFAPDLLLGNIAVQARRISGTFAYLLQNKFKVSSPGSVGIVSLPASNFSTFPVVVTDSVGCWNELETTDFIDNIPRYNPAIGERAMNQVPIVLALYREIAGREQRIIVLGNADCLSNGELMKSRKEVKSGNYSLITEAFRWFTRGEFPVDTRRSYGPDNDVYLEYDDMWWIKTIFMGVIPILLIIGGLFTWTRRLRV
jgi:ABC-2 type transport system permease protein